jgi:site-specific recombinase XerC
LSQNQIFRYDEQQCKVFIDKSLLQQFFNQLPFRDRVSGLCLLSSSQDPADLFSLNVGFVRERLNATRIFWEETRQKTCERFKTFFSKEASKMMKQYINTERKGAGDNDPLFVTEAGERLSTGVIDGAFRRGAKAAGLTNGKRTHNVMRPKRLLLELKINLIALVTSINHGICLSMLLALWK